MVQSILQDTELPAAAPAPQVPEADPGLTTEWEQYLLNLQQQVQSSRPSIFSRIAAGSVRPGARNLGQAKVDRHQALVDEQTAATQQLNQISAGKANMEQARTSQLANVQTEDAIRNAPRDRRIQETTAGLKQEALETRADANAAAAAASRAQATSENELRGAREALLRAQAERQKAVSASSIPDYQFAYKTLISLPSVAAMPNAHRYALDLAGEVTGKTMNFNDMQTEIFKSISEGQKHVISAADRLTPEQMAESARATAEQLYMQMAPPLGPFRDAWNAAVAAGSIDAKQAIPPQQWAQLEAMRNDPRQVHTYYQAIERINKQLDALEEEP